MANRNETLFRALKPILSSPDEARPYADIGRQLGKTEGAFKVAAKSLRDRFIEITRGRPRIHRTQGSVDDEIRFLLSL